MVTRLHDRYCLGREAPVARHRAVGVRDASCVGQRGHGDGCVSRVAVVTGGASGIGLAVSQHLAQRAHRVAVLDLDGAAAQRAADSLRAGGAQALAATVNVADRGTVDDALAHVRHELGPVEIMVTSAAIAEFADFAEITPAAWRQTIAVNLTGTFHCLQAAIPDMVDAAWGRIVTIASSAGQIGSPRQAHYAASKGGVIALTKTLAREFGAHGITANTIPPFLVDTPMSRAAAAAGDIPNPELMVARIPAGRLGSPDDIGAACAFLCSDEASYITGQVIGVNGGAVL
jgi:2-hydroxycyclohexanecarboxyl-CoA dehydrogenase